MKPKIIYADTDDRIVMTTIEWQGREERVSLCCESLDGKDATGALRWVPAEENAEKILERYIITTLAAQTREPPYVSRFAAQLELNEDGSQMRLHHRACDLRKPLSCQCGAQWVQV